MPVVVVGLVLNTHTTKKTKNKKPVLRRVMPCHVIVMSCHVLLYYMR